MIIQSLGSTVIYSFSGLCANVAACIFQNQSWQNGQAHILLEPGLALHQEVDSIESLLKHEWVLKLLQ